MSNRLSIIDRLKLVKRAVMLSVTPNVRQVNVIWQEQKGDIKQHAFFVDGIDPTDMTFLYFSYVAGHSKTFKGLERRTRFLLNKIAVAYSLHNDIPLRLIRYTPKPFEEVQESTNRKALIEHLESRHFHVDLYNNIVLDDENQILTVYLHNLSGQLVGYQQYNPNSLDKRTNDRNVARYFTWNTKGQLAVWGLETLDPNQQYCFIVEGIFKASTLHALGFNAIAVLCNNPKHLTSWLNTLPYRLIAIGDNDDAGKKLVNLIGTGFRLERDVDEYNLKELKQAIVHVLGEL